VFFIEGILMIWSPWKRSPPDVAVFVSMIAIWAQVIAVL
jgi:hypothetical protein